MNKASELFDKVIVNNTKIDINELEANNGKYHVGQANSNIKVEFVLRNKKEIPAQLFKNLDNIKSVKLPETIESIGEGAFEGSSLTYINIPQTVSYIGNGAFEGVSNLPSYVVEKISYIMHKDAEYYSAEDALSYNSCLPGAVSVGDIQTPASEAISEHWIMNDQTYNEDPTYEELTTFETISDEASWNESYANGVLKKYYTKNPSEDVWNINENRACNFNDKIYTVEQYNDADCEGEYEVKQYKAQWYSDNGIQKIIDVNDNSIEYYIPTFFDTPSDIFELFGGAEGGYVATPENLIDSCDKWIKVKNVSFGGEGVGPAYAGWIANGAQIPWICINFNNDANVKPIFKYEGKEDVMPWNDIVFGTGEGHKEWGIASLPQEFGEGSYDVANLQIILEHQDVEHVEASEATKAILYTAETAAAYNAQLPGAVKAGDPKPKAL